MNFKPIGDAIAKYAPLLGSVISIESPLAGVLITLIGKAFNFDPHTESIQDILAKIAGDEDAETKLKQIESDYQTSIAQIQENDRANARDREETYIKLLGKRDWILDFIALIVVFGYLIMCTLYLIDKLSDEAGHTFYMMFGGQLTGGFIMVLSYYFGFTKQK